VKEAVDATIKEGVHVAQKASVGIHLMKFCSKFELSTISDQAAYYAKWLNVPYTGVLKNGS
jgi:hypothetical protein